MDPQTYKTGSTINFPDNNSKSKTLKYVIITIITAVLLLGALWIWKSVEINQIKNTSENEKRQIKEIASKQILQSNEILLTLLAKPFIWALRTEMMNGNLSQVNHYMNDMVKEKNFQRILVANEKGIIVASTDKKIEGKPFALIGDASKLEANKTQLENKSDTIIVMTSPIMGFNSRLGTLYISYKMNPPDFME